MRHGDKVKKIGRTREHRIATLRNLVRELFIHEKIKTTLAKAKEARKLAERLITYGKEDTLAARRLAARDLQDKNIVRKLFTDIAPRFKDITGGYTRIYRLYPRRGDGAEMALLELTIKKEIKEEKKEKKGKK